MLKPQDLKLGNEIIKIPQRYNQLLMPPRKSFSVRVSFKELGLSPLVGIEEIQLATEIYLKRSGICPVERAKVGGIEVDSSTGSILFQVLREYVVPNPFEIKPGDAHRYES